jgi:hypothetical protein
MNIEAQMQEHCLGYYFYELIVFYYQNAGTVAFLARVFDLS